MGAFDHPEWTYDGAFEQLFGLGRGKFEQKFLKNSNARGECLSFDLTSTVSPTSIGVSQRLVAKGVVARG